MSTLETPLPSPPNAQPAKRLSPTFWVTLCLSLTSLGVACFATPMLWELNYYSPGIFFALVMPLLYVELMPLVLPFIVAALWLARFRDERAPLAIPLGLAAIAAATSWFIDTTPFWLTYNDWRFGVARAELYREIRVNPPPAGEVSYLGLPVPYPTNGYLSLGDGPAYYKMTDKGPLLLFLTFEGIPDGFSGFLYAPANLDPRQAWPEQEFEWADVWDKGRNIYFVGNR